jgi:tetratricopeptide (TPR) repeat protein
LLSSEYNTGLTQGIGLNFIFLYPVPEENGFAMMYRYFLLTFYFFFFLSLFGCAHVSIEKASELSLEATKQTVKVPDESFADFKQLFFDAGDALDCDEYERQHKEKKADTLSLMSSTARGGFAAQAAFLSGVDLKRGWFKEANELAKRAYRRLPASGETVRRAVLASSIGRIHTRLGNRFSAKSWFSRARSHWSKVGKGYSQTFAGVANISTANASLAYLEDNLLAEEYFLKQGIESVWAGRFQLKTSVDAESTIARLVSNLVSQHRPVEAEYIAREYLTLYNKYSWGRPDFPILMNALAEALYEQNRLDDSLWVARRALLGHKNACSLKDGLSYTEARKTSIKILSALGDWKGLLKLRSSTQADFSEEKHRFNQIFDSDPGFLMARIIEGSNDFVTLTELKTARKLAANDFGENSTQVIELDAIRAVYLQGQGQHDEALLAYEQTIQSLLNSVKYSVGNSLLYTYLQNTYIDFLASTEGREAARRINIDPESTSNRLKSSNTLGEIQNLLSISAIETSKVDSKLANLVRDLQRIHHKRKRLLDLIFIARRVEAGQIDSQRFEEFKQEFAKLKIDLMFIESQIVDGFPAYTKSIKS